VDFIQKYIFPGGMLPSPEALRCEIDRADLAYVGSMEFGQSYSETLRRWHVAFDRAWPTIEPLGFDPRFKRMWDFYLTSCAAAFRTGTTDVAQVSMMRRA
jgi:cyclopropane-fatty-acyl-phospholipid synthase